MDDPRLLEAAKGINEHERANAEPLDKAVLTLSGAALALSLTFSKDIAPPDRAVWLWLLFVSWGLFVLTIAINIAGYLSALTFFRREWKLSLAVLRHKTRPESDLHDVLEANRDKLYWFNIAQGILFVLAMMSFAIYVGINVMEERHMQRDKAESAQGRPLERAVPGMGLLPVTAPAQSSTAATVPASSAPSTTAAPADTLGSNVSGSNSTQAGSGNLAKRSR